ncbi:hypothetical protein [Planctomicrobium piriforme]|uniref:Uncharacterized protein n=1 Tax=Planctomicrobium piriforme TaxID=1576369 RepID=A0A1I3GX98_9PLAN|nr:hypothetical protein [Planctomicrobium piriforme]SFI28053.1 hypothetical protein SAMN05421753_107164 [Planctomicrobium piriforme]
MSGWLSKAKKAFKRDQPAETAQPFQLPCECGQQHTGLRRQRHQHIVCKACGRSLFVLPRDIYPPPASVVAKKKPTSSSEMDAAPGNKPVSITSLRKRTRGTAAPQAAAAASEIPTRSSSPVRKPAATPAPKPAPPPPNRIATDQIKKSRLFSPFRIVAIVVVLMGMFTTGWLVRQSGMSQATKVAKEAGELGLTRIEEGNWADARQELDRAAIAMDQLGRTDPEAQTIRQYFRETQAMTNLCADPVVEVLAAARREYESSKPEKAEEEKKTVSGLANRYRGQWLIVEGVVRDVTPKKARRRQYEMTLPGRPGESEGETVLELNFPVLKDLVPVGGEKPLIFAGSIIDCERDNEHDRWILRLDKNSGFLWTHLKTYLAAGFEVNSVRPEKAVLSQLNEQAVVMGVTIVPRDQ